MNSLIQLNNPFVKKHLLIAFLGMFLGLLLYNYFGTSINIEEKTSNASEFIFSAFGGILFAYLIYYISAQLDKFVPWKSKLVNRFISGIIVLFIVGYALIYGLVILYNELTNYDGITDELFQSNLIKLGIILLILMLIYNIIYFALYSYYTYSKLQIDTIKYERKQYELQLKALKSQLSSHFLFNNLNTISSLSFKNAIKAEHYIRGLSKIYNYTLNSYHNKLVTIQEDINTAEAYLSLLETRFGNILKYSITISEEGLKHKIPPLTFQMLIENAVKHNQISESNPLKISIYEEQGYIIVSNNITTTPSKMSSFNIGLNNINSRFKLISNQEIIVVKDDNYIVKTPMISANE